MLRQFAAPKVEPAPGAVDDVPQPGGWHLFNDFAVQPITEDEALSFPGKWKVSKVC